MLNCISNSFLHAAIWIRCKIVDPFDILFVNYKLVSQNRKLESQIATLERQKEQAEYCQRWAFSLFYQIENMLTDNKGVILQAATVEQHRANISRVVQNWHALQHDSGAKVWDLNIKTEDEILSMAQGIVNNNPALDQLPGLQKG